MSYKPDVNLHAYWISPFKYYTHTFFLFKQYFISKKNGLDSRLKAYNKSSPCVSSVSNTKVR